MLSVNKSIQLLAPSVIEKIAAGEVVERPVSVVKEVIENAVDAQAGTIDVIADNGGFSCIRIADDGTGMDAGNLKRSVLRHATSKIASADDLFSIATLGFRGEALASIASVSRMQIASSASGDGLGACLRMEGSEIRAFEPAPRGRGTTVEVRDLFFNVPARKKFMKSGKAERMAMLKMLEELAIAFPGIHFTATFDGKKTLDVPPAESQIARISQIAGAEFAKSLIECRGSGAGLDLVLFLSPPATDSLAGARPRYQNLYVNLRRIDNMTVTTAIRQAFARFIDVQFRPSFFCFLEVDPHKIDVNVHPTKKEVKFDDERSLFGLIYGAIQQFLSSHTATNPLERPRTPELSFSGQTGGTPFSAGNFVRENTSTEIPAGITNPSPQTVLHFPASESPGKNSLEESRPNTIQLTENVTVTDEMWGLISCFQIHETYICAPIKNGILLIDQHAAHERILFEQALRDLKSGSGESQQLLFPLIMELSQTEKTVFESAQGFFRSFGFDIQDFGGAAVSVTALPAFMKDSAALRSVREMIQLLLEDDEVRRMPEQHRRFAAAFACGSAIKAGQKLDKEEMNGLLNALFAAENPYTCPHGRPTLVRISMDELARRFLR